MRTFTDYSKKYIVFNHKQNVLINSIAYVPNFSLYSKYYLKYQIPVFNEYRPDKISYELYNTPYLDWVLNEINYFTHGIKEYKRNTIINYLDITILKTLGII